MKNTRREPVNHILSIKSLRDIDARCSCGKWTYDAVTFDGDTDEHLKEKIRREYVDHLKRILRLHPEDGFLVPVRMPSIYADTTVKS